MSTDLLLLGLDAALIVCAVALGLGAVRRRPKQADGWLAAALCCAVVAHVLLGRQDYAYWIAPAYRIDLGSAAPWLDVLRNAAPGLFMLLVHRLFTDGGRLPFWLLALFALQLGLEGPLRLTGPGESLGSDVVPTVLQALFAAAAVWWTVADWRNDLVDARRRSRAIALLALAVSVVASSLLLRLAIPWETRANYDAHVVLSIFDLLLLLALLVQGAWALLGEDGVGRRAGAVDAQRVIADDAALARLRTLLTVDRIYREPGLSLARLAERAATPEYRLRRLIHERLGFRNFNAFLHAYRIAEVVEALDDPSRRRVPILTLALDAGYSSVNTFNRGFREVMGITPSTYRREVEAAAASPEAA